MKFCTIEINGKEKVAVLSEKNRPITIESLGFDVNDMNDLIKRYDEFEEKIQTALKEADVGGLEETEYKLLAPIPVPMQDVICLGVNYNEHIAETADVIDFTKKADTVYFSKRVNRSNDPDGIIPSYDFVDSLDYEVELGVILKKDAFKVSASEVEDYIFGYTVINDVSARNIQLKHQQWYRGKSFDGYTPMGPYIVTADELKDVHDLKIECFVNGEKRQSSNTACMITTVEEAVSELSQGMTLKAGTIIATGTPGGVGMGFNPPKFLKSGDVIKCVIEGIGELVNTVE
ncbi:fumarylacetoacetate hydrolase family protein [Butyrivibrio sp. M55]|uniref:fumarylacetoacetate hydrolase family protein n=1 Tax=Butyrivibrio sp. M55 TaxID=1855323 RepID=UPI0008E25458|nr:fumarylacetoacetate hydrolase family protein [Butyrivibrio sp. M55]SFU46062.1 2-keto-4-pentenoate hydratase/2-oxohepta-3-ene-1,7-dioic acid hydratase (catechol pathway) [Butyrivibrio sp. M55]